MVLERLPSGRCWRRRKQPAVSETVLQNLAGGRGGDRQGAGTFEMPEVTEPEEELPRPQVDGPRLREEEEGG